MTSIRFTFARRASQLGWLLPLGLAGLSAACGSSPSMIGSSAGAAGASTGNAGSSSSTGGSGSDQAGAATSGGSSALGGASTGGATDTGGSTSTGGSPELGGASTGGSPELGGASTGGATSAAGATSAGAGGGTEAGACTADKDCGVGFSCLYKIADGCAAKGSCQRTMLGVGPVCQSIVEYCGCSGQAVGIPCSEPSGYSPAPVSSPKSSAACPATPTPDAACVGKACGASCGTGEVPSECDANGKCIVGGAPICK